MARGWVSTWATSACGSPRPSLRAARCARRWRSWRSSRATTGGCRWSSGSSSSSAAPRSRCAWRTRSFASCADPGLDSKDVESHQPRAAQRAICVGVMPDGDDLSELKELLLTSGVAVVGELIQHREAPHPNSYIGPGKIEELKELIKRADANIVATDDEL